MRIVQQYIFIILLLISGVSGKTKYIKSVNFEGNESITSTELTKLIYSKPAIFLSRKEFNNRKMHLDQLTLKNYYYSQGYLQAEIEYSSHHLDNKWVSVNFSIHEGTQYIIHKVNLFGNKLIADNDILALVELIPGEVFNPLQLRNNLSELKDIYLNQGKALINIVDEIQEEDNLISIRINISEGDTYTIGEIKVTGIEDSMKRFVFRELEFESGNKYNHDKIRETQKKIFSSGIFSSVEITPSILYTDKKVNLDIQVREMDSGNIIGELGFGQAPSALGEGASPITIFQGGGKWQFTNFLNSGNKIGFNTNLGIRLDESISISSKKIEISSFSPWIFKFRLPLNLKYYLEESTEEGFLRKQGIRTSFLYKSGEKYRLNGSMDIEWNQSAGDAPLDQERSLNLLYIYHNTDNFISPSIGNYFSVSSILKGTLLGGSRHYIKFESEYRKYFPLFSRIVLGGRFHTGFIKLISFRNQAEQLPVYDRLYLGGSSSLRGWNEDELLQDGGKLKYLMNLELRFPLFWKIGMELFFDSGKLLKDEYDISNPAWDWNIGYGFTFTTPLGPMRIDVAYQYGTGKPVISNALLYIF